ncbi:10860_t:CDS:2 [Ambispora leptoticha]|uniref:10860_t:CDS:1 n=1 Tax=Ambispora leptoticha TaxID=144679 RepID=A0A9N8V686_9GLOM|nr:10860_t:CDS:2 [Ambispora leptoticha]
MGRPMYVSPSLSKRQVPPKQQQSSQTNYSGVGEATSQNSRTSAFGNRYFVNRNLFNTPLSYSPNKIPEWQTVTNRSGGDNNSSQRSERRRRSLSYDVHQHIQRLHQLQHLHRTREQMAASSSSSSSNFATRRGLHLINVQNEQGIQSRHISLPPLRSSARFRPNDEHRIRHRDPALDDVIRRVNILRQMAQHQERLLRPRYRSSHNSHRNSSSSLISPASTAIISPTSLSSTTPASSTGTPMEVTSISSTVRDELLQQQMRLPRISIDNSTLVEDEDSSSSIQNQHTRILSPIPRRYNHNNTYSNALAAVSSNVVELDEDGYEVDGNNLRDQYMHHEITNSIIAADVATNNPTSNHEDRIDLPRSSASGECC